MNGIVASKRGLPNPEAGNTLIIALLVLFLLTSLGVSYVAVTKGDKQVAGNQLTSTQAFSNAEAGISEVLARMSNPNVTPPNIYLGTAGAPWGTEGPGNYHPGWGRYVITDPGNSGLDPQYNTTAADGLDNNNNASVDEASEHYPEVGSRQNSVVGLSVSDRLDYPWVKVRYKLNGANQIVLFGDHDNNPTTPPQENLVRGIPKLIVTSAGRRGTGQKIVTVEAVKWPLPPVPGSVYTEGQMTFNGNAFYIDGHDHNYTAPYDTVGGAAPLPGISTPNDPNAISSQLNGQQDDNVEGSGTDPSVQSSGVNLDLPAMAAEWSSMADITLSGNQTNPNTTGWGSATTSPPTLKIVHVAGDLHISGNASGAGVLVIDGDFTLSGTFNWNGVVLCLQDVSVTGGGTAKQIVGALMVQGSVNNDSNLNGNIKLLYSSAMISQLNALTRYEVSSWIDQ
ncbi:MAG TPA: PilX N-terminal domain-containing pilus assembly protein [Candidatus Binatia bacterium]|nr:PilX N-terminal domain-containing pilus assembly protein [Candidatus Binatia bacterium]